MGSRRKLALVAGLIVLAPLATPNGASQAQGARSNQRIAVVGTEFKVRRGDGSIVSRAGLIGAVLTIADAKGNKITFRIDEIRRDAKDPAGEVWLYKLMVRDQRTGKWRNLCRPGPDGLAMGFPLAGTWTATGRHVPSKTAFSLTCTSGANGKCVRMGYKPWKKTTAGVPLWKYHQACTRMMRADYCGDGRSYTVEGRLVNIYDRLGVQLLDRSLSTTFEAAWGPDGAICVRKIRVPEKASLQALVKSCPRKLKGRVGKVCQEQELYRSNEALILNRSGGDR